MVINVITPCTRVDNLWKIYDSINFPNYRWLVVFDGKHISSIPPDLPPTVEPYIVTDDIGIMGNSQRNYGIDLVEDGWVYFLDDDTVIHPHLYSTVEPLLHTHDFIYFGQCYNSLTTHEGKWIYTTRLDGKQIEQGWLDSGMYLTHYSLIGDYRWIPDIDESDGIWGETMYDRSTNPIWVSGFLCWYNMLDREGYRLEIAKWEAQQNLTRKVGDVDWWCS